MEVNQVQVLYISLVKYFRFENHTKSINNTIEQKKNIHSSADTPDSTSVSLASSFKA